MILVAKTYWGGMPFWFREKPKDAAVESLVLRTHDMRQVRALWWTKTADPRPRKAVLLLHPRVDFHHHYSIPRLVAAGFGVLAANSRYVGSELMAEHEEMVLDAEACMRWLKEKAGAPKVALFGNSGGGSLLSFYQAEASRPPHERLPASPAGTPTRFEGAAMPKADALLLVAAHRGQGRVVEEAIDPSVVDENDPLATDPTLDMYAPENGFVEPPAWSTYDPAFVTKYRAAQRARVERLDAIARAHIARKNEAIAENEAAGFAERPFAERQAVLKRRAFEPVMVVYRTMANLNYTTQALDPSPRAYGSLLSDRPDLMNHAAMGFARTVTPRAWLSTWSGASSNADLVKNVARIQEPTLVIHAERDREIYPRTDAQVAFEACGASDKRFVVLEGARHYFEPDFGERAAPDVERVMDVIVPWLEERLA